MGDDDLSAATMVATGTTGPTVGQRFAGRYLIERLLGRGGMGSVWAALDVQLGERVALKILDASTRDSSESLERFRREVRLARRITHRNVARIYDIGDIGEREPVHYLTMEWIQGPSLAERVVAGEPWPVERALALVEQIAAGLAAAHACGIVHRDLKPANVLLDETDPGGRAVITDFGIALAVSGESRLTLDRGAWIGTPAYMSPEQVRGEDVDARSDVYACGTILFELLTGRLPFAGDNVFALALARIDTPACDPGTLVPLPPEVCALVRRCLATDPGERPASAAELLAALEGLRDHPPSAPPTYEPATQSAPATFVMVPSNARGIAVLPFRYRGPASDEYLADALTDELVDLLASTRGLRVAARGATQRFGDNADPKLIGRELGVVAVIDGSVQRAGPMVRISARLLATDTGFQTWSERFEGRLDDVFDLQDRMAKRVAESLRVELQHHGHTGVCCEQAAELYLRARKRARSPDLGGPGEDNAIALLDRCLALAPDFQPAIAAHALYTERMWFYPGAPRDVNWRERTRESVERALAQASDLAETHVAAARYAAHTMDFAAAARELSRALAIAPTSAPAHEFLGYLQCETGRAQEGIRHLELAADLDPSLTMALLSAARHHELVGDHARADEYLDRVRQQQVGEIGLVGTEARFSMWRGDIENVRRCQTKIRQVIGVFPFFATLTDVYLGERDVAEFEENPPALAYGFSPRFITLAEQLTTEVLAYFGRIPGAIAALRRAADHTLVDLEWLERCPLLAPLRSLPEYQEVHQRVRARAEQIWTIE